MKKISASSQPLAEIGHWALYLAYLILLILSLSRHELWGDELHSWNIAKGSLSFGELINNIKYEGHPPLWYSLLYILSRFTHDPTSMQWLHFFICGGIAFIFIFRSKLSLRIIFPVLFGYYFLFEYSVLSRNYSLAILCAFVLCMLIKSNANAKNPWIYVLLFFLSNTHLLGLILAIAFQVYLMLSKDSLKSNFRLMFTQSCLAIILFLPAIWFIVPPSNSSLNAGFWLSVWNKNQFLISAQAPLKAMVSIPDWNNFHFWNTNMLTRLLQNGSVFKIVSLCLSALLLASIAFVFSKEKKILLFFYTNVFLTLLVALIFPLTSARYVGFIYVGLIISIWLSEGALNLDDKRRRTVLMFLLMLQLPGAIIALKRDWGFPFSQFNNVKELLQAFPGKAALATDYWSLNYLSAAIDQPVYCIEYGTEKSFLLWNSELASFMKKPDLYKAGFENLFEKRKIFEIYFFSTRSLAEINERDSSVFNTFDLKLLDERTQAIEKYSKIYLYKISQKAIVN